jgi:hypothetical protein
MNSSNGPMRISASTLSEIRAALKSYAIAVRHSDLSENSQAHYVDMADNFVRWLSNDFDPGSRIAPYSVKKKGIQSSSLP